MSGPIDSLLPRLDHVRSAGKRSWRAVCPAHGGKHQNLAIALGDDGETVLLKCFSHGCTPAEIAAAVGLDLQDLFPDRRPEGHSRPPTRGAFSAADALRCLSFEGLVIAAAGRSMLGGHWNEADQERLVLAVSRIGAAMDAVGVRP